MTKFPPVLEQDTANHIAWCAAASLAGAVTGQLLCGFPTAGAILGGVGAAAFKEKRDAAGHGTPQWRDLGSSLWGCAIVATAINLWRLPCLN